MLKRLLPYVTLFSSFSTLICCALPALLVTLGLGASLASFLGSYPELIWFSENKALVFGFGGLMLLLTGVSRWHQKSLACPTDPELRVACEKTRGVAGGVFYGSLTLYAVGGLFAFVAPLFS